MLHCQRKKWEWNSSTATVAESKGGRTRRPALVLFYRSDKVAYVTTHCWKLETDDPNSCQNHLSVALSPSFPPSISN